MNTEHVTHEGRPEFTFKSGPGASPLPHLMLVVSVYWTAMS